MSEHRAGAVEASAVGPGAAEVMPRPLTEDEIVAVVRREAAERREAVRVLSVTDLAATADLRQDADVLDRLVDPQG